jgi:hypothetical protein
MKSDMQEKEREFERFQEKKEELQQDFKLLQV